MCALLSYTGMRFEEVLGLRWENIDDKWINVMQAVVHPTRNAPEVKAPKTKTSLRKIPIAYELKLLLFSDGENKNRETGFILHGKDKDAPLTYTEAKRSFEKIRKAFNLNYTAHDFRDTCATEWRKSGMELDLIARLLGHSKTETTEQRYVDYKDDLLNKARETMNKYSLKKNVM